MAKKKSQKKQGHVSSKVGFTVIALAILVFSALVVTQYDTNNQVQTDQSHAAMLSGNTVSPSPCPWRYICIQSAGNSCQAYAERQVCSK